MYTVCNTNIRNLDLFADNRWEKREFGGRRPTRQWRLVLLLCLQTYIVSVLPIPLQWMWFIFHACLQSIIADLCNRWQQFEWLRFVVIKEKLFTVSITSNLRQHNCTLLRSMSENGKWAIQICVQTYYYSISLMKYVVCDALQHILEGKLSKVDALVKRYKWQTLNNILYT